MRNQQLSKTTGRIWKICAVCSRNGAMASADFPPFVVTTDFLCWFDFCSSGQSFASRIAPILGAQKKRHQTDSFDAAFKRCPPWDRTSYILFSICKSVKRISSRCLPWPFELEPYLNRATDPPSTLFVVFFMVAVLASFSESAFWELPYR